MREGESVRARRERMGRDGRIERDRKEGKWGRGRGRGRGSKHTNDEVWCVKRGMQCSAIN